MVASDVNVLKSTENNSKSCEKPLNGRHDTVFFQTYLTEVSQMGKFTQELEELRQQPLWLHLLITKHLKTEVRMLAPHALKGQKLIAQGNALGIKAISKAPCKGKSFMYCLDF